MKLVKHLGPPVWLAALLTGFVAAGVTPTAQNGNTTASAMLEAAIQKQLVTGDLPGAISQYETILAKFGDQRRIAAQACLRLAQAQEQLGRLDDALRNYQRLIVEHPDDAALLRTVRARITELNERMDLEEIEPTSQLDALDRASRPALGITTTLQELPDWKPQATQRFVVYSDLSVLDRNTGQVQKLNDGARQAIYPLLSPNGQQVAYLSFNGDLKEAMRRRDAGYVDSRITPELRLVGMNGQNDRVIARIPGVDWLRPYAWTSDNAAVLTFLERTSGLREIALVTVQTGQVKVLKSGPWLPAQNMGLSQDGRFLAYQVATSRVNPQYDFFIQPTSGPDPAAAERRYAIPLGGQRGARVTEDDLAIHALNRMGFGPRKGDIDRVKKMGLDAYIEQQLRPEKIADPFVDAIVGQFTSLKMEIPELLAATAPVAPIADRKRSTIFDRAAVMERTDAAVRATGVAPNMRTQSDPFLLDTTKRPRDLESNMARLVRAVHSEKQLQEVLVDFWMNHFSVNHEGDNRLIPAFEEQAIRANVFGKFETMLVAVARSPQMLFYLDNWRSSAPAEVMAQRLEERKKTASIDEQVAMLDRMRFLKDSKGINENFARELLELHTMGVDTGYTQQDIVNVARILTGWTIKTQGIAGAWEEEGVFMFDPLMHVEGDKVVLGQTFKNSGVDEGMQLLKMLAQRPETARFIATKLARRFIADTPPVAVVDEAQKTFLRTGGDLREVVRTILMSPQFRSSETIRSKVKKPFELVASALRAVDATFEDTAAYASLMVGNPNQNIISRMGERMYDHEAPNGNPDVGPAWMNSNALLVRFEFANRLALNRIPGVKVNLASAEALLSQLGIPKPSPQQIEQTRSMMQANEDKNTLPAMGGGRGGMMMTGGGAPAAGARTPPPITPAALTVAAMLGSPQFQKR